MLLYRLCRKSEVDQIINGKELSSIGSFYQNNSKINTHYYEDQLRYLHFFDSLSSFYSFAFPKGRYLSIWDMDEEFVLLFKGIGYYLDPFFFRTIQEIDEYAIPSVLLRREDLKSIRLIDKTIDIEDDFNADHLLDSTLECYSSLKGNSYLKK